MHYLPKDGEVSSKYAVLAPKQQQWSRYLLECVRRCFPEHYARTKQGINYPYPALLELKVRVHTNDEDREAIIAMARCCDEAIERERRIIERYKGVKQFHLGKMFPG